MGHTLDSTKAAYFRANSEQLRETYSKYIPFLTIQKALDVSESPEYQKIKNENQILVAETVKHVVERKDLQEMRKELDRMKSAFKDLTSDKPPITKEYLDMVLGRDAQDNKSKHKKRMYPT